MSGHNQPYVRFRDPYVYPTRGDDPNHMRPPPQATRSPSRNNSTGVMSMTSGGRAAAAAAAAAGGAVGAGSMGLGGAENGTMAAGYGSGAVPGAGGHQMGVPVRYQNGTGQEFASTASSVRASVPGNDSSQAKTLRFRRRKFVERIMPLITLFSLATTTYLWSTCGCEKEPLRPVDSPSFPTPKALTPLVSEQIEHKIPVVAPPPAKVVAPPAQAAPPVTDASSSGLDAQDQNAEEPGYTGPSTEGLPPKIVVDRSLVKGYALLPPKKKDPRGEEILASPYAERLIVSPTAHAIYCPIPSATSSNWKLLLRKFEGRNDFTDLRLAHDRKLSGFRFLNEFTAEEIDKMLRDRSILTFTFVRHPFHRLLSSYIHKFSNNDKGSEEYKIFMAHLYGWDWIQKHDVKQEKKPSFDEFVSHVVKQDDDVSHEHWASITTLCGLGHFPYDFVGKLERVDEDAPLLLRALGHGDEKFPTQEDLRYPSSNAESLLDNFLTPDLIEKLTQKYAHDLRILKYT